MSYDNLTRIVTHRLDQGGRGDRGWWLITRVHLTTARLKDIATYLLDAGAETARRLTAADYRALGRSVEISGDNPGQTLRRHHLLAMETPLRLLDRADGHSWENVRLTNAGISLAVSSDPAAVLEDVLKNIVFCRRPFFTASRVQEYSDFSIKPYVAALRVMEACGGWINRDEYDLFVSRIRNDSEVQWATDGINELRTLSDDDRVALLRQVQARLPSAKIYQNWRDMGLHTFSLFSLGRSAVRTEQQLVLSDRYLLGVPTPYAGGAARPMRPRARSAVRERDRPTLRVPEPAAGDELAVPPTIPAANTGTDAEILVGKLLQANGWTVVYYSNRRGYGFDVWARKGSSAIVVEVKSSLGTLGAIALTPLEYGAAQHHGVNYVLATVENLFTDALRIRFIANPAGTLPIEARAVQEYVIAREHWWPAAESSYS